MSTFSDTTHDSVGKRIEGRLAVANPRAVQILVVTVLAVCGMFVSSAQGQAPPTRGPLKPVHRLAFENAEVQSAAFSPDGQFVYVHVHAPIIDLWPLLLSWWPELLATVCGLLSIWLLIRGMRVRARPQDPSKPYCRRCNYDVSSHVQREPTREDGSPATAMIRAVPNAGAGSRRAA